jgi:hypothetical protein
MALVTNIERVERNIRRVQDIAPCIYDIYEASDGRKYIQIVTLGSAAREFAGASSQTIQFDEKAAGQLKEIIENTFPRLAGPTQTNQPN